MAIFHYGVDVLVVCGCQVVDTHDASNPIVESNGIPLLTCDVSPHSMSNADRFDLFDFAEYQRAVD